MTLAMMKLAMMTKILNLAISEEFLKQESFRQEDIFRVGHLSRTFDTINEHNKNWGRKFGVL